MYPLLEKELTYQPTPLPFNDLVRVGPYVLTKDNISDDFLTSGHHQVDVFDPDRFSDPEWKDMCSSWKNIVIDENRWHQIDNYPNYNEWCNTVRNSDSHFAVTIREQRYCKHDHMRVPADNVLIASAIIKITTSGKLKLCQFVVDNFHSKQYVGRLLMETCLQAIYTHRIGSSMNHKLIMTTPSISTSFVRLLRAYGWDRVTKVEGLYRNDPNHPEQIWHHNGLTLARYPHNRADAPWVRDRLDLTKSNTGK